MLIFGKSPALSEPISQYVKQWPTLQPCLKESQHCLTTFNGCQARVFLKEVILSYRYLAMLDFKR